MSADPYHLTQREHLRLLADRMTAAGAPSAPLFTAAAAGQIVVVQIANHRAAWPTEAIMRPTRPVVVLIAGDPGWGEPTFGPTRWKCAERLRRWAAAAMVHGAAGEPEHYHLAIAMAAMTGRFALVETTSELAPGWAAFLRPIPTTGYLPSIGQHPVPPEVRH